MVFLNKLLTQKNGLYPLCRCVEPFYGRRPKMRFLVVVVVGLDVVVEGDGAAGSAPAPSAAAAPVAPAPASAPPAARWVWLARLLARLRLARLLFEAVAR